MGFWLASVVNPAFKSHIAPYNLDCHRNQAQARSATARGDHNLLVFQMGNCSRKVLDLYWAFLSSKLNPYLSIPYKAILPHTSLSWKSRTPRKTNTIQSRELSWVSERYSGSPWILLPSPSGAHMEVAITWPRERQVRELCLHPVSLSFSICGLEGDVALWVYSLRSSLSAEHSCGTPRFLKDPQWLGMEKHTLTSWYHSRNTRVSTRTRHWDTCVWIFIHTCAQAYTYTHPHTERRISITILAWTLDVCELIPYLCHNPHCRLSIIQSVKASAANFFPVETNTKS